MKDILKNKIVLVTGGTGSFGRKFTEMVMKECRPKKLIIFSRDEMKQYEMQKQFNHKDIRYFVGNIRDKERLHRAFNGVDTIVHAAALKIVPTSEYNPFETVKTNIMGAENIINVAIDNGVKKVIALSTDKAANPVNLYGATKLCAEKMFISANNYSPYGTRFSVIRYGNVVGSGSVIPYFKKCKEKGVIPITDEKMTRFWITLEQGVHFVISCANQMKGGEIFIPKIPSMKVLDLAKTIAPGCKIKIIGMRPGEKLHETLLPSDDARFTVEKSDRFISYPELASISNRRIKGKVLPSSFKGYSSDNNKQWLTSKELKKMIR